MDLLNLAWSRARSNLQRRGRSAPEEPNSPELDEAGRREAELEMLRAYRELETMLKAQVAQCEEIAHAVGASYSEIAEIQGVSRQAIRQRLRLRETERRKLPKYREVKLVGGPDHGARARVYDGDSVVSRSIIVHSQNSYCDEYNGLHFRAIYVRSSSSKNEYRFIRIGES